MHVDLITVLKKPYAKPIYKVNNQESVAVSERDHKNVDSDVRLETGLTWSKNQRQLGRVQTFRS